MTDIKTELVRDMVAATIEEMLETHQLDADHLCACGEAVENMLAHQAKQIALRLIP